MPQSRSRRSSRGLQRREIAAGKSPSVGEAKHVRSCGLELQLRYLCLKRLDFVLSDHVLHALDLCGEVCIGRSVTHSTVIGVLHDHLLGLAAAHVLVSHSVCLSYCKAGNVSGKLIVAVLYDPEGVVESLVCCRY